MKFWIAGAFCFLLVVFFALTAMAETHAKTYQEYLIMSRAINDENRRRGIPTWKPLSKKEWEKRWGKKGKWVKPDSEKSE
jgi:hypothetical protein